MALPEEEEHAVFDDDADLEDTEGDDSDMDDEDEDDDEGVGGDEGDVPLPPPPPAAGEEDTNSYTPSTSTSSDPTLNPNPNPNANASAPPAGPRNGAIPALPLSAAAPVPADLFTPSADRKRRRTSASDEKKPSSLEDSRRLFQRLWTDDDEITILQGFLEFTSQRGTTHASHQYDTGPFYDQIKKRLQLEFNKNQLIEKLRRLKKKYRTAENRVGSSRKEFVFKSPHDKATYEISKKIWSVSIKKSRESDDDDLNPHHNYFDANNTNTPNESAALNSERSISRSRRRSRKRSMEESAAVAEAVKEETTVTPPMPSSSAPAQIPNVIEETVKNCLSPLFKELLGPLGSGIGGGPSLLLSFGGNSVNPLGLAGSGAGVDEKWRKQQILELEVYLKRTELMRDQIKSTLEELRSSASGS